MLTIDKIKMMRNQYGVSQGKVAKEYVKTNGKVGCSKNFITMIESGDQELSPNIYKRLIDALHKAYAKELARKKWGVSWENM